MPARAYVISDLHLGGGPVCMMTRPRELADFISGLPRDLGSRDALELVIAGDFVDFLAVEPHAAWTPEPSEAVGKLDRVVRDPRFEPVFAALARHVGANHRLTVLVGNHDVELALPAVQDALLRGLGAGPHAVRFVDDGRAYRIGGALIEHGNRYDGANRNDWTGLRALVSAQSRHEDAPDELLVSVGSDLVEKVINPLKRAYPFVDLLQPEGELVALLLIAFEPQMIWHLEDLAWLLRGRWVQQRARAGLQPGKTRHVAADLDVDAGGEAAALGAMSGRAAVLGGAAGAHDAELAAAFGDLYVQLRQPRARVGVRELVTLAWQSRQDSLSEILDRGDRVPADRLAQIRVVLRRMVLDDLSDRADGPTGPYGRAAERIIEASRGEVEVVVMGHTHQARHLGRADRAHYINTGTWADVIRVPAPVLEPGSDEELESFLRDLWRDVRSPQPATYGELVVHDGHVETAMLRSHRS